MLLVSRSFAVEMTHHYGVHLTTTLLMYMFNPSRRKNVVVFPFTYRQAEGRRYESFKILT